jgi:carbon-monoxide dehydrogenase medium subunit
MKEGLIHYERLINIKKIRGLGQLHLEDGVIHIGALSTHRKILESALIQEKLPVFGDMEQNVANIRVREVGTLAGNLCFAEPHADPGTLLLALGATVVVAKVSSQREFPMEQFFVDAYETCLEPDELLTEIRVPVPAKNSATAYLKFGYLERPSVGVAFFMALDQERNRLTGARLAVGCVGPAPRRIEEAEALFEGKSLEEASTLVVKAGEIAARGSEAISDLHGSQDYKEHLVQVLVKRAFQQAHRQCLAGGRK